MSCDLNPPASPPDEEVKMEDECVENKQSRAAASCSSVSEGSGGSSSFLKSPPAVATAPYATGVDGFAQLFAVEEIEKQLLDFRDTG
ncbi:hypothetical protein F2Q68_00033033 [Brassica cretica]|uniref:Uncharacterized protein n=1 Tax=Brassica cretica TaxID=69181 RepID=A0A8S9G4B4_BRACR|nr:hypothetical protein F2Q68_00033033 [Brassica cretica]